MGDWGSVRLTHQAKQELREGDALVFDWHTVAMCCAAAGEMTLRRTTLTEVQKRHFVPLRSEDDPGTVFAHRRAFQHLATQQIEIDCHRLLGRRRFTSDLPPDFGLRAVFGRLPATHA